MVGGRTVPRIGNCGVRGGGEMGGTGEDVTWGGAQTGTLLNGLSLVSESGPVEYKW